MHKRKLLALVVAGTIGVPVAAYADTANVNVYGKLYPQYQVESAHGATAAGETVSTLQTTPTAATAVSNVSHHAVEATNSYIGFKGEADAGGGIKGWFQVEQRLRMDTGNGSWASRNSAAGISGAFGNVFLGNWDTVYKQLGDPVSFLGVSSGNFVSVSATLSEIGFGNSASAASFHLRRANHIEYDSPTISGVQVMLGFSPDEGKTYATDKYIRDIGVKWEAGPLYVALANELHNDFFGGSSALNGVGTLANGTFSSSGAFTPTANTHSTDKATRLSAKYAFGGTEIGGDIAELEYKEKGQAADGKFSSYKKRAVSVVGTQKLGALSIAASVVKTDKGTCKLSGGVECKTDGLDATQINLGAKYDFSKRVSVFGIASRITNGKSARYTLTTQPNSGADPEAAAVGLIVSF